MTMLASNQEMGDRCFTLLATGVSDHINGLGKGAITWDGAKARNITSHKTVGIGAWSDAEIKRAITQGVRPDGTRLKPPMDFSSYAKMTNADLEAIVAYLRTIEVLMARFVGRQDDDIRFALGVIDDHRRLIAAGKTHRWDMVKWAVTVNMALAGASVTLRQDVNAKRLFCLLAFGVVFLSVLLMWEITRRMTAARNASLVPEKFLIDQGVDVVRVTGETPPEKYELNYDKQENALYFLILLASALPAFLLWLF
jgi:hypothetical protein